MIEVRNLRKEFNIPIRESGFRGNLKYLFNTKYEKINAVDDISFDIYEGDILGYIGTNGAGKSTTIKLMCGILHPTSGQCWVNGYEPYKRRRENAKNIGVVLGQRSQLWWDLPVIDTYKLLKKIYEIEEKDYRERLACYSNVLGLEKILNKPVRTLSLGQRMRAELAAVMLHKPKVLYFDEPTIGLDIVVKERVREYIKYINEVQRTTIVLTTHDIFEVENLCNRMILINSGKKQYEGTIDEFKSGLLFHKVFELHGVSANVKIFDSIEYFRNKKRNIRFEKANDVLKIYFNEENVDLRELTRETMRVVNDFKTFNIYELPLEEHLKRVFKSEEYSYNPSLTLFKT